MDHYRPACGVAPEQGALRPFEHLHITDAKRRREASDRRQGHFVEICDDRLQARTRDSLSLARSEEHTPELQSLMRISYAVFCLNKKTRHSHIINHTLRSLQT